MAREGKQARREKRFGKPEKLADAVQELRWMFPAWVNPETSPLVESFIDLKKSILEAMPKAKVVDASNVAEFFYSTSSQEEWVFQEDFHCYALPFSPVFIEMRRPPFINSEGRVVSSASIPDRWGWLFESMSIEDHLANLDANRGQLLKSLASSINSMTPKANREMVEQAVRRAVKEGPAALDGLPSIEKTLAIQIFSYGVTKNLKGATPLPKDGTKWVVEGRVFTLYGDKVCMPGGCAFRVSNEGRLMDMTPTWKILGGEQIEDRDRIGGAMDVMSSLSQAAFMTLSFMGCKNVAIDTVEPDHKLNRERTKHGLKPFVRYHTVNIDPMRKVLKTEGGLETNGLKKALHICRGHFARYSEDKPLFGHTSGLVWRPAHTRGVISQGLVVSDYNVSGPKSAP